MDTTVGALKVGAQLVMASTVWTKTTRTRLFG